MSGAGGPVSAHLRGSQGAAKTVVPLVKSR